MSLEQAIMGQLKTAMKEKNQGALRALRAVKSAILLAKTEKGAGDSLTEEQEIKLLQKMVKQRKDSISIFKEQGRDDLLGKEQEEVDVLEQFLPTLMNEEAIKADVAKLIADTSASGMQDMGKVMGAASKHFAGKADMSIVSAQVKQQLAG